MATDTERAIRRQARALLALWAVLRSSVTTPEEVVTRLALEYAAWLRGFPVPSLPQIKTLQEDVYSRALTKRAGTIHELANVDGEAVRAATLGITSPTQYNRALRQSIGLQPRQVSALAKKRAAWTEQYGAAQAEKLAKVERARMLDYRADLIARTEMNNLTNAAQLDAVREQQRTGKLPLMLKQWSTRGTRVCPICQGNEDDGPIPVDDNFGSGDSRPGAHPGCYCILEFTRAKGAVVAKPHPVLTAPITPAETRILGALADEAILAAQEENRAISK